MIDKKRFDKTVLTDDSEIYNKDAKNEKECIEEMSKEDKWKHFKEYYLLKIILIAAAVIFVGYLLYSMLLKPRDENVLYVAVIDETLDSDEKEALVEQLKKIYGADGDSKKVIINDNFYTKEDAYTKLEVYLSSQVVDVIIADEEVFKQLAAMGYMLDLSQLEEDKREGFDKYYYSTAGYLEDESAEISFEDNETGKGEVLPYGITLDESEQFNKMSKYIENPIAGIVVISKQVENASVFLELLINE